MRGKAGDDGWEAGERVDLDELRERLSPVLRRHCVQKALVFGSFARDDVSRHSDLDLILVQRTERRFLDRYDGLLRDLVCAVSEYDLDVLIYTPEELLRLADRPFIASALREGKAIYESSEE